MIGMRAWLVAAMGLFVSSTAGASDEIDFRGPLRLGVGWTGPLKAPAVLGGFHDQFRLWKPLPWLGVEVVGGLGFVGAPPAPGFGPDTPLRGFSSFDLGAGLSFRSEKGGPLLVTSAMVGLVFDSPNDTLEVIGAGFTFTADVYPLYLNTEEAIRCDKGAAYTYIGSGLFMWTQLRDDIFTEGAVGASWAAGFGVDVVRAMMLPPIAAVLHEGCSKPRFRDG